MRKKNPEETRQSFYEACVAYQRAQSSDNPISWQRAFKENGVSVNPPRYLLGTIEGLGREPAREETDEIYDKFLDYRKGLASARTDNGEYPAKPKAPSVPEPRTRVNPELEKFKSRELLEELRARGWRGKLQYTYETIL